MKKIAIVLSMLTFASSLLAQVQKNKIADEVFPYLQSPTPTSIYVCWRSVSDTESIVKYGTTESLEDSSSGEVDVFSDNNRWHSVQISGLEPNTVYYYKIETVLSSSGVSKFKTPPLPGTKTGHLRFVIRGDTQDYPDTHTMVAGKMHDKLIELYGENLQSEVDFIFTVGDLVGTGWTLPQWETQYFAPIRSISKTVPFMAVPGNHDQEADYYYKQMQFEAFGGDEGEKYYKYQIKNALFIGLNTNIQGAQQITWLDNVVTEADADSSIDWIFAFQHHPGWSALWSPGNTPYVQNQIIPTLQKSAKVEILFHGHTHGYERAQMDEGNLRMVLTGGSGGRLDRWDDNLWVDYPLVQKAYDHYNYVIIDIDLEKKSYTAETYSLGHLEKPLDNVLLDSFYRKREGASPPDKPTAIAPLDSVDLPYTLVASDYFNSEPLQSSWFQVSSETGNYEEPIVDANRNFENILLDTGAPKFEPIDQNEGIDLSKYTVDFEQIPFAGDYFWRVRYRNQNLQWSEWSGEQELIVRSTGYFAPRAYNKSLRFNGIDSYIEIADNLTSTVLPQKKMTVETWVRLNSHVTWGGYIGAMEDNGGYEKGWVLGNQQKEFSFALASKGTDDGDGFMTYLKSGKEFEYGKWYHVAATYSGSTMSIYVNGILMAGTTVQSGDILYDTNSFFDIGNYHDDNEFFVLDGEMDEIRLWNAVLPPHVIQEWMHGEVHSSHPNYANLVSEWRLNEIGDNTVTDEKDNNNGQIVDFNVTNIRASTAPVGLKGVLINTVNPISVGVSGTELTVLLTSSLSNTNYLGAYQSGLNEGENVDYEVLPAGINIRSQVFWGVQEYGSSAADLEFHYSQIQAIPGSGILQLMKRENATSAWTDITADAQHDNVNKVFQLTGETEFGEYAIGWDKELTSVEKNSDTPIQFQLFASYPNPFNPGTAIRYVIAQLSDVKLTVYNSLGQKIVQLVDAKNQNPGLYEIYWRPVGLSSGIYFYHLEAGDFVKTHKMIYVQ